MARPKKKGLDYFPKNVDFYHKQINRIIYNEHGIYALVLYDFILCYIYENEGYYMVIDRAFWSIVKDGIGLDKETAGKLLEAIIDNDIFDRELYENYSVLTSAEIQKIYLIAKRKKSDVIDEKFYLLEDEEVSDTKTGGFCSENPPKKSKEKKSKVKESKVNKIKENKSKSNLPLLHQRKEEEADFIRQKEDDEDDDEEKCYVINEFKNNISETTPVIENEIKKWVSLTDSDFVVNGICKSAKRGAKTWQYVETLLKNEYENIARYKAVQTVEIDSELGF